MSIVLQSSGGGQITIQEPATASNFTQTLPAATGTVMVSGNQPSFHAYLNSGQVISSATWTKVNLDTETFDTNNNFASSRFTPTVAGYYQINASAYVYANSLTMTGYSAGIYKNGSQYAVSGVFVGAANTEATPSVSAIVYCNGSTDYIEMYARITGTTTVVSAGQITQMSGSLVRSA